MMIATATTSSASVDLPVDDLSALDVPGISEDQPIDDLSDLGIPGTDDFPSELDAAPSEEDVADDSSSLWPQVNAQ
ncbi:MAG: hypothetical protein AAF449_19980, partial [Myxococcota bacterium]